MEPISVAASITGIIAAAGNVCNFLRDVQTAPDFVAVVLTEIEHVKRVFRALKGLLDKVELRGPRAALIQLDDLTAILTQTVLVFSKLQTLAAPSPHVPSRLKWAAKESEINRLITQLQWNKSSLCLLLRIIEW